MFDIYCEAQYLFHKIIGEVIKIWKQLMVIQLTIKADYKLKSKTLEEKETHALVLVSQ